MCNKNEKDTYEFLKIINESKKARMEYEAKMAAIRDEMTRLHVAEQKGIEIGMKKGRMEEKMNVAKNLIALGADTEMIIKATGLTEEEIRKIKEEMENYKN